MSNLNFSRIASRFAAKGGNLVVANVHDFTRLASGKVFRVVVSCVAGEKDRMAHAISEALKHEASVVPGSFRKLPQENAHVGYIVPNNKVRDYNQKTLSSMQVLCSNMLMDNNDESIWTVKSSGDTKYLCRQSEEDLSELIQIAKVRSTQIPSCSAVLANVGTTVLEYAAFVDPHKNTVRFGFITAANERDVSILARDSGRVVTLDKQLVIESADLSNEFEEVAYSNQELTDYYRQVYGFDPDYFNDLDDVINQRASF
jgi:hypothetical protein